MCHCAIVAGMGEIIEEYAADEVWARVEDVLDGDDSGHGADHVRRVYSNSMRFARDITGEPIDLTVVGLAAQLHDVDDYKLVGRKQAEQQVNAVNIMNGVGIDALTQLAVRGVIASMGYSKALKGIRPTTIEGRVVSDADMCDAIGASGIVRALTYALSSKGSGVIFKRETWPMTDITAEQYNGDGTSHGTDSFINHFFEKLLKLKGMMLTEPGRKEAEVRDEQMVSFLRAYFREEDALEWERLLESYIKVR